MIRTHDAHGVLLALVGLTVTLAGAGCVEPLEVGPVSGEQDEGADDPALAQQIIALDAGTAAARPALPSAADAAAPASPTSTECSVGPVPEDVRRERKIGAFYKKYASASGIPIMSSGKPVDKTLILACQLVNEMTSERPDVRAALILNKVHFTIIATSEKTTDPPEFSHLPDYYNQRARGLGGRVGMCAEESILCDRSKDRWYGESICVHEFSHTISMYGLYSADRTFQGRLEAAFREAKAAGLWANTYAGEQPQEYWAEGVQSWYDTNLESARPNGVHGPINTQGELRGYDRKLYDLVDELLPEQVRWDDCYRRR